MTNDFEAGKFRQALGSFTTGVTVVTTVGPKGEDIGLTANSFNSVSLDPPMILWSLAKSSLSLEAFKAAEYFAVHILASDQEELSGRFARRGEDKFAGLDLERGRAGVPLLDGCAARFFCRTAFQYEGGDHIIFVGEVTEFDHRELDPLLFHSGQYGQLLKPEKSDADQPGHEDAGQSEFLGDLLRRAYGLIYAPVNSAFEQCDISVPQYYYLSRIAMAGDPHKDTILKKLELIGRCPSAAELQNLGERELVTETNGAVKLSPKGQELNMQLASRINSVEVDAEEGLDYQLRQTLKLALSQLIQSAQS